MKFFFLFLFVIYSNILAQPINISGKIIDTKTNQGIPYVNIGIKGKNFGTSSNEYGEFKISLRKENKFIIISSIGYETIQLDLQHSSEHILIKLKPIPIELSEVIVNSDENPAYSIIRKAIKNKLKNKDGLKNYFYNFYSKNQLISGKEIVFLEEDIGEGFNELTKEVVEFKTNATSTKNISNQTFINSDLNFFEKKIIDFSEDSLTLGKFVFHLPISKHAFDYYDYELIGIKQSNKRNFYEIKVIPYSTIRPLFSGKIIIDDSSYALAGLDLVLESRNFMPYTEIKFLIIQNLSKIENYWLPTFYSTTLETNLNFNYLFVLDSAITSFVKVFNNHKINIIHKDSLLKNIDQINDSTFKSKLETISLENMDSLRLYPLSPIEESSYKNIDSTKEVLSSLKLGGVGGKYIQNEFERDIKKEDKFTIGKIFKYLHLQNNRVDGIASGLKYSTRLDTFLNFNGKISYSFLRKQINSNLSLNIPYNNYLFDAVEFSVNYGSFRLGAFSFYSDLWNTIAVSLGFEDQFNYIHSSSGSIGFNKTFNKKNKLKLGYIYENQKLLDSIKYFSLFKLRKYDRLNTRINDANNSRLTLSFQNGKSPFEINFLQEDGFTSQIEFSSNFLGSNFNYISTNVAYQFFTNTFYDELFFSPYLGVLIEGYGIWGKYNLQHLFTPQTAMGIFSPLGTFKSLTPYQFIGDKSISLHLEHNWRKTFFDMMGLYFPVAWNFEFTNGFSALSLWNKNSNIIYWEVYGGISGILGILNFNIAYNKFNDTTFRLGLTKIISPKF